ncbi:MAG: rRNA maturation RNase YbeY [Acidimicrobiia bacterium]
MNVFVADEQAVTVDTAAMRKLAESVLKAEGCPSESEVSVILVDETEMASYNERFLKRTGPTDVISLPIEDLAPGRPPTAVPAGPPPMLGDVILAPSVIRNRATDRGVNFEDEMALLVVHGLLHLLGYDHDLEEDAEAMESREHQLLEAAGRWRP